MYHHGDNARTTTLQMVPWSPRFASIKLWQCFLFNLAIIFTSCLATWYSQNHAYHQSIIL